ncbi:MAG: hypothetical protein A2W91_10365 [Bacteroidetes bacterium GWF2_38_335]|nr:MAG: hypothetical protein A2W91_10365 [Bacteroidetes bacterium GWF2_38_335]OFY81892.1 MAG: hypothetical protein A2281_06675 [Bacteroidetes bacterium RIFOXYA12_FULL_38_20]HBS87970.1 hypothetical protein [Bacteroidales bacterium]
MKKYLIVTLAILFSALLIISCNDYGTMIDVENGEVYYSENVEEQDAQKIADWLKENFFPAANEKPSVQIDKDGDVFIVKFVTVEGADLESVAVINAFRIVQVSLSKELNGAEIEVWLCDRSFEMNKKLEWNDKLAAAIEFGEVIATANGDLFYKNVSKEEAQTVSEYLEPSYFVFQKNSSVQLDKSGNSYIVNFVFRDDVDVEDESLVANAVFSQVEISKLLNNSPVVINFCNSMFESRKEIPWDESNIEKYNFGTEIEVIDGELCYTETVTKEDAEKLAKWLETNYFAEQKNTSVQVKREDKNLQVKFVMRKGLDLESQDIADYAKKLKEGISKLFKGTVIEIHLCNSAFETQKFF